MKTKILNTLNAWIEAHRSFSLVASAIVLVGTLTSACFSDRVFFTWTALLICFAFGWVLSRSKKLIAIILAANIVACQTRAVVPVVVGGTVVVVAGVVIYKTVRFCQKHFPKKDTNAPPEQVFAASYDDSYGAAWTINGPGSCYVPPPNDFKPSSIEPSESLFEIKATLVEDVNLAPGLSIASMIVRGEQEMTDLNGLMAELTSEGLSMNTHMPGVSYCKNGRAATVDEVPIRVFDGVVEINTGPTHTVTVEKSMDLQQWVDVLTMKVPIGQQMRIQDVSSTEQIFYRLTVKD